MCAILFGHVPATVVPELLAETADRPPPWEQHALTACPLTDPAWPTVTAGFPLGDPSTMARTHPALRDAPEPWPPAPTHDWRAAQAAVTTWWERVTPWWAAADAWQTWWTLLGTLPYGRILAHPATGTGWVTYRPRRTPFAGHSAIRWQGIIETGMPPLDPCICGVGDPPTTPLAQSVWYSVLAPLAAAATTTPPATWLILECDADYDEEGVS